MNIINNSENIYKPTSMSSSTTYNTFSSSSSSTLSLLDHFPPSDHLCYVHCNLCDSVLAVSVPCTSLFKSSVSVRCGHCTNLVPLNMRGLLLSNYHQFHSFFSPSTHHSLKLPEEMPNPSPNFLVKHSISSNYHFSSKPPIPRALSHDPPILNTPPGKRQKVLSAYNRFIKEEIQRIKNVNPSITHREAFSAAAKNWAHFPDINFGLNMGEHAVKKKTDEQHQEG